MKINIKATSFSPKRSLTLVASGVLTVDVVTRGKCLTKGLKKMNRPGEERLTKLLLLLLKKKINLEKPLVVNQ